MAKRKRGRPRIEGAPRDESGKIRRASKAQREAAMMAVVEARCRAVGIWPDPIVQAWGEPIEAFASRQAARLSMIRAAMSFVGLPWMGCNAGRAIAGYKDVVDLWQVIQAIRIRHAAYQRAIDAPRSSGRMNLMVAPDRRQDGAEVESITYDDRTEGEKAKAVIVAWERLAVSDDLVEIVIDDIPPISYPLAAELRKLKEHLDGAHPKPVAGQSVGATIFVARSV